VESIWRSRRFIWFATGNTGNNIGDALYAVVLPLFVYHVTHELAAMSVMTMLAMLPLIFAPVTGISVDRWGPGRLIVPALGVQIVTGSLMAVLAMEHSLPVGALYALGGILEVAGGIYRGSWMASLPQVFPGRAPQARAALGILYVTTTLIGPFVAGLLLPRIGYVPLLWVNVASFVLPLLVMITGVSYPSPVSNTPSRSLLEDLIQGWQALKGLPLLLESVLTEAAQNLVVSSGLTTVLMYYLRQDFRISAAVVSWIVMADGAGALVASILVPRWGQRGIRWILPFGSVLSAGVLFGLLVPHWWIVPVILFLLPLGVTGITTAIEMAVYHQIAPEVLGRVNGIARLIQGLPALLCPLVLAALSHAFTIKGMFVIVAVFMTIVALATLRVTRKAHSKGTSPAVNHA
jgi:MFS family permease